MVKATRQSADYCSRCEKCVRSNSRALKCEGCETWVHITCDPRLTLKIYTFVRDNNTPAIVYICPACSSSKNIKAKAITTTDQITDTSDLLDQPTSLSASPTKHQPSSESQGSLAHPIESPPHTPEDTSSSLNYRPSIAGGMETTPDIGPQLPQPEVRPPHIKRQRKPRKGKAKAANLTNMTCSAPTNLGVNANTTVSTNPPNRRNTATNTVQSVQTNAVSATSLIVFNLPESNAPRLADRESEESASWRKLCADLKVTFSGPPTLVRLQRSTRSPHRPLRVTLQSELEIEKIIIASSLAQNDIRIQPDISWAERQKRNTLQDKEARLSALRKRSVIIHGVPELGVNDRHLKTEHDTAQWSYIRSKLHLNSGALWASGINRLPRPPHLNQLTAPRLLRVTLATEEMATTLLSEWYTVRGAFPRDIRLHADTPREIRARHRAPTISLPTVACADMGSSSHTDSSSDTNALNPVIEDSGVRDLNPLPNSKNATQPTNVSA